MTGGAAAAAALRTAPWPMLSTSIAAADADALVDLWLDRDPHMPGINALLDTARSVADAWARRSGGTDRCRTAMAMHSSGCGRGPPEAGAGHAGRGDPGRPRPDP